MDNGGGFGSSAYQLMFPITLDPTTPRLQEKNGVVYTKPWVVELILDLAGYTADRDLVSAIAVEPAAGDGAFLIPMIRRLVASCRSHGYSLDAMSSSLIAYELSPESAALAKSAIMHSLAKAGVSENEREKLATRWIRTGDYLLDAPHLPAADFVIGNPPYIRLEDMDSGITTTYRAAYRTMHGRADIYVAFFEAALRGLKPGGVCAFICADRWMLNHYGAKLRQFVTTHFSVEAVVEMHTADAFAEEVSAYPAITVLRRSRQGAVVVGSAGPASAHAGGIALASALREIQEGRAPETLPGDLRATRVDTWFRGTDPWPSVDPARLALLKRLEQAFHPLESAETGTRVGIGVATGADNIFITTNPDLVESSRLLPLAMGPDTVTGTLKWSGHYLVNPWSSTGLVNLADFPRLRTFFEHHRERLMRRHVAAKNPQQWYRTIDRVNHEVTELPKLYIPDIKDHLNPVLDSGYTYPHHNLYVIRSEVWDLEVLGGLLLSRVGQFFVECYGVRMRGGYLRFQAQYLRRIRVPHPGQISPEHAVALAQAFRSRDRDTATQIACEVYGIEVAELGECR